MLFVMWLIRHSPTYDNILTLAACGYNIFTTGEYAKDPDTDHTASGAAPWCSRIMGGVKLFLDLVMVCGKSRQSHFRERA